MDTLNSPRQALTPAGRRQRLVFLAIALLPLVGSVVLNLGLKIPFLSCPLMRSIGVPCPAWGLTRSFMAIARGHWQQAIDYHLLGPVFFLGFVIAGIHVSLELIDQRRIQAFYIPLARSAQFQIGCCFVLFVYHGTRLHQLGASGQLVTFMQRSPHGQQVLEIVAWLKNLLA